MCLSIFMQTFVPQLTSLSRCSWVHTCQSVSMPPAPVALSAMAAFFRSVSDICPSSHWHSAVRESFYINILTCKFWTLGPCHETKTPCCMGDKSHMQQVWVLSYQGSGVLRPQVDTAEGDASALGEPHLKPASDGPDGNGIWWVLWKF